MTILEASTISEYVPRDLPALQILRRDAVGPIARICAVGDIGLSGRPVVTAERFGWNPIFSEVIPFFHAADVVFGNLESPLCSTDGAKMFVAPIAAAQSLSNAGFTLLHLANNHISECGQASVRETLATVRAAGILPLGAGDHSAAAQQLVRTDINGLRIGWLGCGRTLLPQNDSGARYWEFNEEELTVAVTRARQDVDLLLVSIHIGLMYMDYPRPEHKIMAETLMVAGADLILMHHAHVLQGVQVGPKRAVCCYNLGNFVFDWEEGNVKIPIMLQEQNEGGIFLFDLDTKGVAAGFVFPTWIDEHCRVHWATGVRGHGVLRRLQRISQHLDDKDFRPIFERQRAERNTSAILKVLSFHVRRGNWAFVLTSLRGIRWEHIKMLVRWLIGVAKSTVIRGQWKKT